MDIQEIITKAEELKNEVDLELKQRDVDRLIAQFQQLFNKENLSLTLNINNYVRNGTRNTFTWWVEEGTTEVANISGGSGGSAMFQLWSNKNNFKNNIFSIKESRFLKNINRVEANRLFPKIKENILRIINFAENNKYDKIDEISMFWKIFKMKIAFLYFPNKFTSIMKGDDIEKACKIFGLNYIKGFPTYSNSILFQKIKEIDYFKNWTSYMIGSLFYRKLFKENNDREALKKLISKAKKMSGSGGETSSQREFKEFIAKRPDLLNLKNVRLEAIEYKLLTQDSIDVLFCDNVMKIAVEVKSKISPKSDILRGILQCIKYKYLIEAEQILKNEQPSCSSILALEGKIPTELNYVKNLLGIEVIL